jgi:predicted adenine nucleotide alpha hydrolase (AANH) superfamily ATPase
VLEPEYDLTVYYYNPNILPREEYELRKNEQIRFIEEYNSKEGSSISYIEGEYLPERFHLIAKGREAEREGCDRCFDCIRHRMEVTAAYAKEHGFDVFTTTLTVSPHKNAPKINEMGAEIAARYGIAYLPCDFKKKDGYKHSIQMSKEYALYRQSYCGCGLGLFRENSED